MEGEIESEVEDVSLAPGPGGDRMPPTLDDLGARLAWAESGGRGVHAAPAPALAPGPAPDPPKPESKARRRDRRRKTPASWSLAFNLVMDGGRGIDVKVHAVGIVPPAALIPYSIEVEGP